MKLRIQFERTYSGYDWRLVFACRTENQLGPSPPYPATAKRAFIRDDGCRDIIAEVARTKTVGELVDFINREAEAGRWLIAPDPKTLAA